MVSPYAKGAFSANGEIVPLGEARIPAQDRGNTFGDAIFETILAVHGRLIDFEPHLARLREGAEAMHIPIVWSDAAIRFDVEGCLQLVNAPRTRIRIQVSRGTGGSLRPMDLTPNRYVFASPEPPIEGETFERGVRLHLKQSLISSGEEILKTPHYAFSAAALTLVAPRPGDTLTDLLWANREREVTCSSTSNVFFLGREGDQDILVTPPLKCGVRRGVTREILLRRLNLKPAQVSEEVVHVDELARFDEVFLTSSIRGIVPVTAIDRHAFHSTRPTAKFWQVLACYLEHVRSQVGFSFDWKSGEKQ